MKVRSWGIHRCLVSELVHHILKTHKKSKLARLIVVLPTERLALAFSATIAKSISACLSPQVFNIEGFCQRFAQVESLTGTSELCQELTIASIIRKKAYKHLHIGHEHEINQLFNDLSQNGLLDVGLSRLSEVLLADPHHDQERIQSLFDRVEELANLKDIFFAELAKQNFQTQSEIERERAEWLTRNWPELDLPIDAVYLVGFTTLKGFYLPLIQRMLASSSPCVSELWLSQPPTLLSAVNPLAELYSAIQGKEAGLGESCAASSPQRNLRVLKASSLIDEIESALALVEMAQKNGIPASKIAILLPEEGTYGKLLRTLLSHRKITANFAVSLALSQSPIGVWLNLLFCFCLEGQKHGHLQALLSHPLTQGWISGQGEGYGHLNPDYLARQIAKAQSRHGLTSVLLACDDPMLDTMLNDLATILSPYLTSGRSVSLRSHLVQIDAVLKPFLLPLESEVGDEGGIQASSVDALHSLMDSFLLASKMSDEVMNLAEFSQLFMEKMTSIETRSIGYPLRGVQILNLIESRYVPFDVVIILGCVEGAFPKGLPKDDLVDNWLKSQIGLPGWQYVEALEDTTYHLLRERIPNLFLCYPKERNSQACLRSRFVEQELALNPSALFTQSLVLDYENDLSQGLLPTPNWQAWHSVPGAFSPDRSLMFASFDSQSLSNLLACPYRFLLARLGFSRKSDEILSQKEGGALHKILQGFITGKALGKAILPEIDEQILTADFKSYAMNRLSVLSQVLFPSWPHSPIASHLRLFSWPKFCEHLQQVWDLSPDSRFVQLPPQLMLKISDSTEIVLELKDSSFVAAYLGSADRVDLWPEGAILTDYKRRAVPIASELAQGLIPDLILQAKGLGEDYFAKAIIGYYSILDGTWEVRGAGAHAKTWDKGKKLLGRYPKDIAWQWQKVSEQWSMRCQTLLVEKNSFTPEPGKICRFCDFSKLCRS